MFLVDLALIGLALLGMVRSSEPASLVILAALTIRVIIALGEGQ